MELLISLLAGAVGGNLAGKLLKKYDLGPILNSVAGIFGGSIGGKLLTMVGAGALAGTGMSVMGIIGQLASGAVGGAVLLVVVGVVRSMLK